MAVNFCVVARDRGVGIVEWRLAFLEQAARLLVVVAGVAAIDVTGQRGHRRVEVEGHVGDLSGRQEPVELPHDLLGPADREGRDEQDAAV